jgi:hypothetical protein
MHDFVSAIQPLMPSVVTITLQTLGEISAVLTGGESLSDVVLCPLSSFLPANVTCESLSFFLESQWSDHFALALADVGKQPTPIDARN